MENNLPQISGFIIERELGQSDDSSFYHGTEKNNRRKVLIKLLNPIYNAELGFVQSFIEDAKALRGMQSPGIIKIVDFGQDGGFYFTAYERPVVTMLDRLPQLTLSESIDLFQEIVKAVDFMHTQGYVHGHLTPGSIMFREDGSLAVMNLGTFILQSYQNTFFDESKVSPAAYYKSPEQCRNQGIDNRSDHYSLGAIFYNMITKRPPYQAENTVGVIVKHVEEPPPQLSQELIRYQPLVDKMMAKDPQNRTQNGREILDWLTSGGAGSSPVESIELNFNSDFEPRANAKKNNHESSSPYLHQPASKTIPWKLIIPSLILLLVAGYMFVNKNSSSDEGTDSEQVQSGENRQRSPVKSGNNKSLSKSERLANEIGAALDRGDLSVAEAMLGEIKADPLVKAEAQALQQKLADKKMENIKQQYQGHLAIAEAALNLNDLVGAEAALAKARQVLVGPELLQLEALMQQKATAPPEKTEDLSADIALDSAEDDRTFQRAMMTKTKDALIGYLEKFPKGLHKNEAERLLSAAAVTNTRTPVENKAIIKPVVVMTLSAEPAAVNESVLMQIVQAADYFEINRNKTGRFDNPLKLSTISGCQTYVDAGIQRMWLSGKYGESLTLTGALAWIKTLNDEGACGFTDWRLPTVSEAASLLRPKGSAGASYSSGDFKVPEWIWTSSLFDSNRSWAVFFTKGVIDTYRKTDTLSVIAVRTQL